ncbi:hypothetical protein KAFR_0C00710 [Kazachstania africana CBS 2517]|uniref:Protein DSF2 n=1 Tax=Kazachstania africana (strain ATCC 22294 / BCRC 22015 / CBS 2517 / CECT 1963 / NBRC 1671 / NRRL Y-8276) TaxID=1071382 RepID=H2ARR6_KAZAF|nr:hypothetical protein KAFR_0C00710 [Kazachstania africana CBS 2517]CCF57066.1 hypothetical protein KAFR_0C00710 [Kazachstania africana CBS 2517]
MEITKTSPLEEIRRENYLPRNSNEMMSSTKTSNGLGRTYSLRSNFSAVSFDSVVTTERLLDKLELSTEDQLLFEQVVQKEKERNHSGKSNAIVSPRTICMPASQFPSLRMRQMKINNSANSSTINLYKTQDGAIVKDSIKQLLENDLILKDKSIAASVEQHYASTSRFSYVAEEDPCSDELIDDLTNNYKDAGAVTKNTGRGTSFKYGARNNVANFEKFRILNEQQSTRHSSDSSAPQSHNGQTFQKINFKGKQLDSVGLSHAATIIPESNKRTKVQSSFYSSTIGTGSTNSASSQFSEIRQPAEHSPDTIVSSSESKLWNSTPVRNKFHKESTPKGSINGDPFDFENDITFIQNVAETSSPLTASYKSHKKKSSLSSLKSLFRTTKSSKNNQDKTKLSYNNRCNNTSEQYSTQYANDSHNSMRSNSISVDSSNSLESSPSRSKSSIKNKFIFPPNPVFPSDKEIYSNTKSKNNSANRHFRSFSDVHSKSKFLRLDDHKTGKDSFTTKAYSSSCNASPIKFINHKQSHNRRASIPNDDLLNEFTASPSMKNVLATQSGSPGVGSKSENLRDKTSNNDLISSAIAMRKVGNMKASAEKLQKACKSGDKTAFLLYGLALRHGYGVTRDLSMSFKYILMATGLNPSQVHSKILECSIDPSEIEKHLNVLPERIIEPLVPAIYECGIAYLKGYGVDQVDEHRGLKFLEKSASMGHVDSMCICGIIWSQKSTCRKKDIARAAAWFRIAEKRGANLLGSDWIHKKKYMKRSKS